MIFIVMIINNLIRLICIISWMGIKCSWFN